MPTRSVSSTNTNGRSEPEWITVVSGLPRSGTSLMMQMLAAGRIPVLIDEVRAADPDNPRGYFEYERVKRTKHDASWTDSAAGKAVKVVYALLKDLPPRHEYRVIWMRRPLDEVISSQRAMLTRLGRDGARIPERTLAERFGAELAQTESWLRQQRNFRMLDISYHDCVDDPAASALAVSEFLGGFAQADKMAAAVEPALYRQRLR